MSYVLLLVMLTSITVYQIVVAGFPTVKLLCFFYSEKISCGEIFLRLCKYSPSILSASNKNYPTSCQTVVLYFHWNSILRKTFIFLSFFSHYFSLLNYSFLSIWAHGYLFHSMCSNSLVSFCCSNCPRFVHEEFL